MLAQTTLGRWVLGWRHRVLAVSQCDGRSLMLLCHSLYDSAEQMAVEEQKEKSCSLWA